MSNKYKTPHTAYQNVITFTCSDSAIKPLLKLFDELYILGELGSSRVVNIDWDGDGGDRLDNINVNGLTLDNWNKEWNRLNGIRKEFKITTNVLGENEKLTNEDY